MQKRFSYSKIFLSLLLVYTIFFIMSGILAPVMAHHKQFYIADIFYILMHKSCNQEALRCFWLFGYQMAICARCFGAYIGVLITIILWLFNIKFNWKIYLGLFIVAFGEILIEYLKLSATNNYIRFLAGIALGSTLIISLYYFINYRKKEGSHV